ncbi:ATP-dependent nuclease [Burkholderia pyrrocinia]|uniref:ATP-dependent nuclease n=1 Tax=Burkholderia pyrrocinia TaxID=60550 RepID=UPI0009E27339|nr:ATP-binding protein [Burkholderia pyrrocinia]
MYKYKLNELRFCDDKIINPGRLTIIVGANNSGKSKALKDIASQATDPLKASSVIVKEINFTVPSNLDELREAYKLEPYVDENKNVFLRYLSSNLTTEYSLGVGPGWEDQLDRSLKASNEHSRALFANWIGNYFISLFSTEDRLKIAKSAESSPRGITTHLLQALYNDGIETEAKVREIVKKAFQKDIRLDFSSLRTLLFRVADDLSNVPADPREAATIYDHIEKLDDQGDGIRSFVATVLAILVGSRPVLLLDEPEAFLHPPQAFRLGEVVAQNLHPDRQVIVATHSAEFLRGVLSQTQEVSILRLVRTNTKTSVNVLDSAGIARLANDPLLSSSRVLDGLFYNGAIVVEADADAVFYQRVGRQLSGADNFHLVHAHNKQTVAKVLQPYQTLGVKHAAIVDFDVIRVKDEFQSLLKELGFTQVERDGILTLRQSIIAEVEKKDANQFLQATIDKLQSAIGAAAESADPDSALASLMSELKRIRESGSAWYPYKKRGREALNTENQAVFDKLSQACSQRGLFIVPVGELEGWLEDYGVQHTSNKSKWIVNALKAMPSLHVDQTLRPWSFVKKVFLFLND